MHLDHGWIESHIPHHGRMCLLDEVIDWGCEHIRCVAKGHRAADHPLRARGELGIASGIECAAQAMAVHGALAAGALEIGPVAAGQSPMVPPESGFIAGVREVQFYVLRLDDVPGDLICDAVRVAGDALTALYEFELRSATMRLLSGRATVLLDGKRWLHL